MLASLILATVCYSNYAPTSFDGSVQEYAAKISETGATRYSVDATLQHEPILIRSPDLALESPRIRELVAQAVEGEWVETRPNQFRLEIGRATAAKLAERDLKQRTDSLTAWFKELKRTHRATAKEQVARLLEEVSSYDRRAAAGEFTRAGGFSYHAPTPALELLTALLLDLGPTTLAKIPLGDTQTWSNVPVGEQERFPPASQSALATFQSVSEKVASALAKEDMPKDTYPWEEFFDNLRRDRTSCRVLLTVLPNFVSSYRLRVYDRRGELVDTAMLLEPYRTTTLRSPEDAEKAPAEHIPLTDSSAEFMRLTKEADLYNTDISRHRDPPQAKLLTLETFEPLTVGFGELFTDMSDGSAKSIVAYLPDTAIRAAVSLSKKGAVEGKGLWSNLLASGLVEVVSGPDALVVRPENPARARHGRVGRFGLHHYARQVLEHQGTTPRIECTFYFEGGPGVLASPVSSAFRHCLVPLVPLRGAFLRYWLGALLGGLGDPIWTELEAGRGVAVRNLPMAQKLAFRRWLEYGGPGRYEYEPSVTSSNAIYDYQLYFDVSDDPLVLCTTLGEGAWANYPQFPRRLSEIIESLVSSKITPDKLSSLLNGRYDLIASTSTTAVARLGYVEWVGETLGDDASKKIATDVAFKDWPEALRTRVMHALSPPPGQGAYP
ncbi:MAG: hypothetical protein M9921_10265 [Fimbriimonadaceae bacterium]|nr:hypothetical protein [Chthonomonadaceae bacterium]MCO5297229.1 hypothetical protein [Fimbriimonadaceae bacterium]